MTVLITCDSVSKSYTSHPLFSGISFSIFKGDRIGVIGPNGSGKSTFFKILAGLESTDSGILSLRRSLRVGYVPQDSVLPLQTVEEVILEALEADKSLHEKEKPAKAARLLSKLGFEDFSQRTDTLSGGWKKRLAIAAEIAKAPDLLLLDEPTNHLDLEGILWLENFLLDTNLTYMVITHDRFFLEHTTNRMIELNKAYPQGLFQAEGSYSQFLEKREEFLKGQLQREQSLGSKVRREVEWLKQNPKARTTKSQSRIQQAEKLIKELSAVQQRNKQTAVQLNFQGNDRDTKKLIVATNIWKSYEDRNLFSKLDVTLSMGTRLGIAGGNGCGKSTLLKILAGEIGPDKGTVKFADGIKVAYFDQQREQLPPDITLRQALAGESDVINYRGQTIHVNGWCKRFLFSPEKLDLPVRNLSGGEKARVLIARLMKQPADVLLLDEPTNDLDIPTLDVLEESLKDFPGAVVLITHDRYLLDRVCSSILGLGTCGNGSFFADYLQWEAFQESKKLEQAEKEAAEKEKTAKSMPRTKDESVPPPVKKLSYNEKRELEQMESSILAAEGLVREVEVLLSNPDLANQPRQYEELCRQLHQSQEALETLYTRWQELEAKQSI